MATQPKDDTGGLLNLLRQPFPPNQISKLPKETRAQIDARKANSNAMVFNCKVCGGHHHKDAVHLDYVGHAALTDRLLDTDVAWSWEPVAFNDKGLPAFDQNGGLWIKLTVHGVTRLGYGSADGKSGGDAVKEIIGDALRNAAMRFGAALELWHKGDLHADNDADSPEDGQGHSQNGAVSPDQPAKRQKLDGPYTSPSALKAAYHLLDRSIRSCGTMQDLDDLLADPDSIALMEQMKRDARGYVFGSDKLPPEHEPLMALISRMQAELNAPTYINAG